MEFKEFAKQQFEEWRINGKCSEAIRLNNLINPTKKYFDETNPGFFYGDMNSPLVLIHHNPKRKKEEQLNITPCEYKTFEDFWGKSTFFGRNKYGLTNKTNSRGRYDKFDLKQIQFLKPFNILPFKSGNKEVNLEIVIDRKLQLDLIPFGSPGFDFRIVGAENIKPYFDRIFELILSVERKCILFCGAVFKQMQFSGIIRTKTHKFKLKKKDGTLSQRDYELINIELDFKGTPVKFSIATDYAVQGLPMAKYGEKVAELYQIF